MAYSQYGGTIPVQSKPRSSGEERRQAAARASSSGSSFSGVVRESGGGQESKTTIYAEGQKSAEITSKGLTVEKPSIVETPNQTITITNKGLTAEARQSTNAIAGKDIPATQVYQQNIPNSNQVGFYVDIENVKPVQVTPQQTANLLAMQRANQVALQQRYSNETRNIVTPAGTGEVIPIQDRKDLSPMQKNIVAAARTTAKINPLKPFLKGTAESYSENIEKGYDKTTSAILVPYGAAISLFLPVTEAAKIVGKQIIDPKTGATIKNEYNLKEQGQIALALGTQVLIGSTEVISAAKGVARETAIRELNAEIVAGKAKFTPEEIASGRLTRTVEFPTGRMGEVTLEISPTKLRNIQTVTERMRESKITNIKPIESVGATTEKQIIDSAEKTNPELATQIKRSGEIGKVQFDYYGKPQQFYFVRNVESLNGEQRVVTQLFKLTKGGKVQQYTLIPSRYDEAGNLIESSVLRRARPSEIGSNLRVGVEGSQYPLEVSLIDQYKPIGQLKTKSSQTVTEIERGTGKIRKTQVQGTTIKTGGKARGTRSFENIKEFMEGTESPLRYAEVKIDGKVVSKSEMFELFGPEENLVDSIGIIYGKGRSGQLVTKGEATIEKIEKPIVEFYIEKPSKPYLPELTKEQKDIIDNSDLFKFKVEPDVTKEAFPSYVGGEGGQVTRSEYTMGTQQYYDTLTKTYGEIIGGLDIRLTGLKVPRVNIKGDTINIPSFGGGNVLSPTVQPIDLELNKPNPTLVFDFNSAIDIKKIDVVQKDIPDLFSNIKVNQDVDTIMRVRQDTMQFTDVINIPNVPEIKIPEIKIPEITFPEIIPPFVGGFSGPGYGSQEERITPKQRVRKAKTKYTASIGAAVLQSKPIRISKKEYQRLQAEEFTGLETRPIFEITDKSIKQQAKEANAKLDKQIKETRKKIKNIKALDINKPLDGLNFGF